MIAALLVLVALTVAGLVVVLRSNEMRAARRERDAARRR